MLELIRHTSVKPHVRLCICGCMCLCLYITFKCDLVRFEWEEVLRQMAIIMLIIWYIQVISEMVLMNVVAAGLVLKESSFLYPKSCQMLLATFYCAFLVLYYCYFKKSTFHWDVPGFERRLLNYVRGKNSSFPLVFFWMWQSGPGSKTYTTICLLFPPLLRSKVLQAEEASPWNWHPYFSLIMHFTGS